MSAEEVRLGELPVQIHYVHQLIDALRSARLSRSFPDVARVSSHLHALCPHVHGGHYPELAVSSRSGLPSYREWARVVADRAVAREVLASEPAGESANAARGRKIDYHRRLLAHEALQLDVLAVDLRRLSSDESIAHVQARFDKLARHGLFVRTSVDMTLAPGPLLSLKDGCVLPTAALKALLYPLAEGDAEWAMMRLREQQGVAVERVEKGTIGPVFLYEVPMRATRHPLATLPLAPGQCVASFGSDVVGGDVQEDLDDDPLTALIGERLSEGAGVTYRKARARWGYHVFKSRKFVCSPELQGAVRRVLQDLGTQNAIYPLRGAR